ncbi:coiled-coil domain-containing protein 112-like [Macrobrachium rosenbergii]|uniref:coiled-coil domain-containing protein 112-like n=1 Tax=Macrobrachium rosenbergii TaxID=79674 RepID=UPI0034D5BA80
MDSVDLHRLRLVVNSLWRRVLEGETKVNIQEGVLRVGVHSLINRINFNRLRDGPLLSYLTHGDIGESPSMKMKSRVTDLIYRVEELKYKVTNLPRQVCESVLKQSNVSMSLGHSLSTKNDVSSKLPEIELITNHIAYIKVQFHVLKRNGSSLYAALEECECDVLKDISALNDVIKEESECVDVTKLGGEALEGEKQDTGIVDMCRNVHRPNCNENENEDNFLTENYLPECSAQSEVRQPCIVPYFKHSWEGKDHQLFIKVLGKIRDRELRLERLCRMFPYKSEEEIIKHFSAYEEFLKERENVKTQIAAWKQKKNVEKRALENKVAKERKHEEIRQKMKNKAKEVRLKRERELRYGELLAWKAEMNEKKMGLKIDSGSNIQAVPPIKKQQECSGAVCSLAYSAAERQVLALQLKDYHDNRDREMQKAQKKKEEEEKQMREKCSASHRVRFLERDNYYIKQKIALKEEKEKLISDRIARLEKIKDTVKVKINHNRESLMQPTQSHLAYKLAINKKPVQIEPVNIDSVPHLGIPSWRQGL